MKNKFFATLVVLLAATASIFAQTINHGHGLQEYKLDNGLTVFLWEDKDATDVHGRVVCRAGAVDEPSDYSGLAHYLEHMLFKGTDKIGAIDWEKEKPLYEQIIKLYDEFNAETDENKRLELIKKINEVSLEAAQYGATNDFANLTEGYGGDNLNAFTSYDLTAYFNTFPAGALEKWLEINSERLLNPVFRSFQAELENVYEEFNMYQDDLGTHQRTFLFGNIYKGTPYERDVIGFQHHLKNPSLSKLIEFFQTWYVPNNMCLMLVGNFDAESAKPLIAEKFGRLQPKELPARAEFVDTKIEGTEKFKAKLGYTPQVYWVYPGIKKGDKDELALSVALQLLNNGHNTGLLDKLMLDNTLSTAYVSLDSRREAGRIMVFGMPYYDVAQRTFETFGQTQRYITKEIDKLRNEQTIPDWLFKSVKDQLLQGYTTQFESTDARVNMVTYSFAYGEGIDAYLNEDKAIQAITKADVVRVINKYLPADAKCMTLEMTEGDPKKNKLAKPAIKPLNPPKGVETAYAKEFKAIPVTPQIEVFNNFADVTERELYKNVKLFYTPNTENGVFSLTLKYGVGTHEMPKLQYAASLMNTAGMMPNLDAQAVRRQYSELGATFGFSVSDSYFYITVNGDEKNLDAILALLSKHVMMPNLDDKQIKSVISNAYWSRYSEKRNPEVVADALLQYVLYGEHSHYIDRIPMEELYKYSVTPDGEIIENYLVNKTNLTTTIQEAFGYAVDIHYCGQKPIDEVAKSMNAIPMKERMLDTNSPYYHARQTYDKTNVVFLADSKVQQAKVYFYANSNPYDIKDEVGYDAFNQYFSGGFSGLVMNEIREKRSMAYTAYGYVSTPSIAGKDSYLFGYVGTQGDKVADAIDVFMSLLTDMPAPENAEERMENIRTYLHQSALTAKPGMRAKSQVFEQWKKLGYTDDPAKVNMTTIDNLTYEDIKAFYEANIKGKPVTIVVIGDPKTIDQKAIQAKWGKITKMSPNKLFKGGI